MEQRYIDEIGLAYAFSLLKALIETKLNVDLSNIDEEAFDTLIKNAGVGGIPVVTTAGDGAAYTATSSAVEALTAGTAIIMIPHTVSTSTTPTLNINDLGAKYIRRKISTGMASYAAGGVATWLAANRPTLLIFDGTYWLSADLTKPAATDLQGAVPVANGGTGATSIEAARTALGVAPSTIPYEEITDNRTLTTADIGKVFFVNSAAAVTITIPALSASATALGEIEIQNLGSGDVTVSGTMYNNRSASISGAVISTGDAVALKAVSTWWSIIGAYEEV